MDEKINIRPCIVCRKSLTQSVTTSFPLSKDFFKENKFVLSFIQNEIKDYAANPVDRICLSCYKDAETIRDQSDNSNDNSNDDEEEELETITDLIDNCLEADIKTESKDPLLPREGVDLNNVKLSRCIEIPGYARLPISRQYCIMKNCHNKDLNPISNVKRSEILAEHSLYLSRRVKICSKHEKDKKWDKNLNDKVRSVLHDFTESQIMDMIKMMKLTKSYFSDFLPQAAGGDDDDEDED